MYVSFFSQSIFIYSSIYFALRLEQKIERNPAIEVEWIEAEERLKKVKQQRDTHLNEWNGEKKDTNQKKRVK